MSHEWQKNVNELTDPERLSWSSPAEFCPSGERIIIVPHNILSQKAKNAKTAKTASEISSTHTRRHYIMGRKYRVSHPKCSIDGSIE
jgi:hypothetical protein